MDALITNLGKIVTAARANPTNGKTGSDSNIVTN